MSEQLLEQEAINQGNVSAASQNLIKLEPSFASAMQSINGAKVKFDTQGIKVNIGETSEHTGVAFLSSKKGWDLTNWRSIQVEVTNTSMTTLHLGLRADTPSSAGTNKNWAHKLYQFVQPGERKSLSLDLYNTEWMIDPPINVRGLREKPGQALFPLNEVNKISVIAVAPDKSASFSVNSIRVEGAMQKMPVEDFLPFIDKYGQFIHATWPNKVNTDQDFAQQKQQEERDLAQFPGPKSFNKYGGWINGPQLEATGHFRVTKLNEKWWLVDPEGRLFWSAGPDIVATDFTGHTGVDYRENYFEWLPEREGNKFSKHYFLNEGWAPHGFYKDHLPFMMFDFHDANLQRKYGDDWQEKFAEMAHRRLRSWGMNTIAAWGDPSIYRQQKTAYTTHVWVHGAKPIKGSAGYWGQFPDVFDPNWPKHISKALEKYQQEQTDPWNIGFYVDNEMGWGDTTGLALAVLASPADQSAKKEFIHDLKTNHRNIQALNAAWGTKYQSWENLLNTQDVADLDVNRARPDLEPFYRRLCEQYFRTIKQALKTVAPNKLYLGVRFAWRNDIAVEASARYVDVVSYNAYQGTVESLLLPNNIDRPLIIGEFNFQATDTRGFGGQIVSARDQAHRGERYIEYIKSALVNPQIVGAHWFEYTDESPAGRPDGENWNNGIVSGTDFPHYGLVNGIREIGYEMYNIRAGSTDKMTLEVSSNNN
ncbi:beta-galactosidase [Thalassotalea agariperforans]